MSDFIENNFLEKDRGKATEEFDCYSDNYMRAIEHMGKGQLGKAATSYENIARSLHELQNLKNSKETHDKAWFMLKQIEPDRTLRELVHKQLVKAYD
jgi:hypothetical protein